MPKPIRNAKTGKFAGSIGHGKTHVPLPPDDLPARHDPAALTDDVTALFARFTATNATTTSSTDAPETGPDVIEFDKPTVIPWTGLRGIYTEYLASVDQLDAQDLDDMTGPYNWAKLQRSITKHGIRHPIHIQVDDDGTQSVINGCHRAYLAWQLRLTDVPVIYSRG